MPGSKKSGSRGRQAPGIMPKGFRVGPGRRPKRTLVELTKPLRLEKGSMVVAEDPALYPTLRKKSSRVFATRELVVSLNQKFPYKPVPGVTFPSPKK